MYTALIVEDEPLMQEYLLKNLSVIHREWKAGACARNGVEALELLQSCRFDLVITDIKMPRMDGLELAGYIHKRFPGIYLILLTGYDEFEYARVAVRAGVTDYLLKPLKDAELHNALNHIAEKISGSVQNSGMDKNKQSLLPAGNPMGKEASNVIVQRARAYIQANYTSQLSLNELAELLSVNPAYLSSIFKSDQGENFSKYVLRLRMERAGLLLRTYPAAKINEIAEKTGYVSARHFDTAFKKYYGITPNEYRAKFGGL